MASNRPLPGSFAIPMGVKLKLNPEDSTWFRRKVSGGAPTNRFPMSGKQILEAVVEAAGLMELSR